jgi:hypothetical protein
LNVGSRGTGPPLGDGPAPGPRLRARPLPRGGVVAEEFTWKKSERSRRAEPRRERSDTGLQQWLHLNSVGDLGIVMFVFSYWFDSLLVCETRLCEGGELLDRILAK